MPKMDRYCVRVEIVIEQDVIVYAYDKEHAKHGAETGRFVLTTGLYDQIKIVRSPELVTV